MPTTPTSNLHTFTTDDRRRGGQTSASRNTRSPLGHFIKKGSAPSQTSVPASAVPPVVPSTEPTPERLSPKEESILLYNEP